MIYSSSIEAAPDRHCGKHGIDFCCCTAGVVRYLRLESHDKRIQKAPSSLLIRNKPAQIKSLADNKRQGQPKHAKQLKIHPNLCAEMIHDV